MNEQKNSFENLIKIMAHLRSPEGCPWDREQTPESIKHNILEEAYEVMDAIDTGDAEHIKEELGDLLLQVVFQSQMAAEKSVFTIDDVISGITEKLRRRHPHIFGDLDLKTSAEVLRNWELIKTQEKEEYSHLNDVPKSLPALTLSQKLQNRAARVGFDWPESKNILEKLSEEVDEFFTAKQTRPEDIEEEFGDVLFTLVNMGRHLGIESEAALRKAANKFRLRFQKMESAARAAGLEFTDISLGEKDALWEQAKKDIE